MVNKIERKAIELTKKFEKKEGRRPEEVKRAGYDIKSGKRCIEVKGVSDRNIPSFIWITRTILRKLGKDVKNYYIYIVYDIKNKPKLLILTSDIIFSNLDIDPILIIWPRKIKKVDSSLKIIEL